MSSGSSCVLFEGQDLPAGTVVQGIDTFMTRLPHYRVGTYGVLIADYQKRDSRKGEGHGFLAHVDWGPDALSDRISWSSTEALVVVDPEGTDLPDWIQERQRSLSETSETACRFCGTDPFPGTMERNIGDPPEVCAADHKPPSWGEFTRCCNVQVGSSTGYKHGVSPTIGLGDTGAIARGLYANP